MSNQDIINLEIKLAFQERLIDDLNQIVIKQQASIDKLNQKLNLIEDKLDRNTQDVVNPPPPHH